MGCGGFYFQRSKSVVHQFLFFIIFQLYSLKHFQKINILKLLRFCCKFLIELWHYGIISLFNEVGYHSNLFSGLKMNSAQSQICLLDNISLCFFQIIFFPFRLNANFFCRTFYVGVFLVIFGEESVRRQNKYALLKSHISF